MYLNNENIVKVSVKIINNELSIDRVSFSTKCIKDLKIQLQDGLYGQLNGDKIFDSSKVSHKVINLSLLEETVEMELQISENDLGKKLKLLIKENKAAFYLRGKAEEREDRSYVFNYISSVDVLSMVS